MMHNEVWVRSYLRNAAFDVEDARADLRRHRYPRSVIRAASAIEYSVKAALFALGNEPPAEHDISRFLADRRNLFPRAFRAWVDAWADANERTSDLVIRAKYGSRPKGLLPDALFAKPSDVEGVVEQAEKVQRQVVDLVKALSSAEVFSRGSRRRIPAIKRLYPHRTAHPER